MTYKIYKIIGSFKKLVAVGDTLKEACLEWYSERNDDCIYDVFKSSSFYKSLRFDEYGYIVSFSDYTNALRLFYDSVDGLFLFNILISNQDCRFEYVCD